jgi:type I restriction enzyme S subunit
MKLLPKGWMKIQLNEILEYVTSGSRDWSKYYSEEGVNFIRTQDINKNELSFSKVAKVALPEKVEGKRTLVLEGDILITITGANVGKCALIKTRIEESYVSQSVALVRLVDKSLGAFIQKQMMSGSGDATQLQKAAYGMGRPVLNLSNIRELDIVVPPISEQKRIVEKLDEVLAQVDTIKARLDGIPAILKRFRQSVLASAVSGKLLKGVFGYQSTEVGDPWSHEVVAPEHWKLFEFKNAVKIIGGSQPPKSEFKSEPKEGLVRLIQIRDYKSEKYMVYIPIEKARRFCSENDIMIGRYGPPIFQILRGLSGAYNVALMKAEPAIEELDKEYLYRFLQNPKLFNYIDAGSDRTAGQAGVNKKFLESYPLFLPPIEEQKEIVRLVDNYFNLADTIEAQVKKAQARVDNLTQSILAKAFRGELVPQDSNDEPADKLLERIAQARIEAEALAKTAKKGAGSKKSSAK